VSVWSWVHRRRFNSGQYFFRKGCSLPTCANVFRAPDVMREGGVGGCLHIIWRCPAGEGPGNSIGKAHARGSLRLWLSPLLLAALGGDWSSITGATYQGTLGRRRSAKARKSMKEGSLSLLECYDGGLRNRTVEGGGGGGGGGVGEGPAERQGTPQSAS